jgi:pimeloyl-ACP methyl ester carboxylesterase
VREQRTAQRWVDVPTSTVSAAGADIVYRELGPRTGVPLVALTHLGANLDDWDPRLMDGLAEERHVVAVGYRGVGASTGQVQGSIEAMAADVVAVVEALGHERVDLFGQSMGGMVAQAVAVRAPHLVDRLVLASSGPTGGSGLARLPRVMVAGTLRALLTRKDPKEVLFFTRTPAGRSAAKAYLARLEERTTDRDAAVTLAVLRAQLGAVRRWGSLLAQELSAVTTAVLVLHGDSDVLVPPVDADELAGRLPSTDVHILPDAGHGAVAQHGRQVVAMMLDHLRRPSTTHHDQEKTP